MFKRAGLNVRLQVGTSGAAVAGGEIDIAASSMITGFARGVRFKIVAGERRLFGRRADDRTRRNAGRWAHQEQFVAWKLAKAPTLSDGATLTRWNKITF